MDVEAPCRVARWPIARVAPGHKRRLVLMSGEWVRVATHFLVNTFLCPEVEECAACGLLGVRAYWYLPCRCPVSGQFVLVEMSASSSADLEQRLRFAGLGVRAGVEVECWRKSSRRPLSWDVIGQTSATLTASLHEWVSPLMAIYHLPHLRPGETLPAYGERVRPKVLARAELAAASLRDSAGRRVKGRLRV